MMRRLLHRRADDRGATLVLVALGLVVLVGFVGFAVDLGRVYNERRQEQSAVDAGALAAARNAFIIGSSDDIIFDTIVDQTLANMDFPVSRAEWVAAWQACSDPGRTSAPTAAADGYYVMPLNTTSAGVIDCISFTADRGKMRVKLPSTEVETLFAQLLGVDGWNVNALAEVTLLPFATGNNVIPFGMSTASTAYGSFQCIKVPPNGQSSLCQGSNQGNFGYLDIKRPTTAASWSCNGNKDVRLYENTAAGIDHFLGTRSGTSDNTEDGGLGAAVEENCPNVNASLADPNNDALRPNKIDVETGNLGANCGNPNTGSLVAGLISSNVRTDGSGGRLTRVPNTATYPWATYWRTRDWDCGGNTYLDLDDTPLWWFMDPGVGATNWVDGSPVTTPGQVSYTGVSVWSALQQAGAVPYSVGARIEDELNALDPVSRNAAANQIRTWALASVTATNAPATCDPVRIETAPSVLGIDSTLAMANCFNDYSAPIEAYRILTGNTDPSGCSYCYTTDLFTRDSNGDGKYDMEYSPRFTWIPEMHQELSTYLAGGSKPLSIKRFRGMFLTTLFTGKNNGSLAGSWSVGDTPTNTGRQLNGFAGFVFDYEMLPQEVIDRAQEFPDSEPGFQLIR